MSYSDQELRLLQLLSRRFPSITAAHNEMINLYAIMALPKGTDHYLSDIHGAYDQFDHILRHASGAVRRKLAQTFEGELTDQEQIELALLVYHPEQKLRATLPTLDQPATWIAETIVRLARVARTSAQKYTRSKVRKRLDSQRAYVLEELLSESEVAETAQKEQYYRSIVATIVELGEGETFIVMLADLIRSLVIDRLYVIGDIYDRGPAAEKVMDRLMRYHYVSIQWGNHDVSWMGAASGCPALVANVVRVALRYSTLSTLIDGYGINLRELSRFADTVYSHDPCHAFRPKVASPIEDYTPAALARMHKAIAAIQFKLEAQIIRRHPEYQMEHRLILDGLDLAAGTARIEGRTYQLLDANWPTMGGRDRSVLTPGEAEVIADLCAQFQQSTRLQRHIRFLYSYGNMFQVHDGNLKFHGCLPVDEGGNFIHFLLGGEELAGPALLTRYEQMAREAFFNRDPQLRRAGQDALWYLWCGEHSPLYGRLRMATFERYVIADPASHEEPKGPYYALRDDEVFCRRVLAAFGADPEHGHIINGHTPVKTRRGERPLLANGKLIIIDGGMSEAYQHETGIAGYTLVGSSHVLILAAHEAFTSAEAMIRTGHDPTPHTEYVQTFPRRLLIGDTDTGTLLRGQLEDLRKLVAAYREGVLIEQDPL
ncbi:fructose-1,6-bisphosphatase [Candidatus Chloroploca sp. M-50]|uniref:Fructose-1,6-bisphosphatase n=1 Tax=Candidatus Chloroploca mongolica TaxID=2528176 RepID=A0ABS4D851_9CHLR|nr:fructose-1,6-bisphosphatase [Candidatus Chloroploca mongolica]MBP1465590.1 fructose-1,6-bisphosphatase [Candidatus Chloroploca mongolica]